MLATEPSLKPVNRYYSRLLGECMGEVVVDLALENAFDRELYERGYVEEDKVRQAHIKGVVDTGAVMLMLPENVVSELGLRTLRQVTVTYADERKELRAVAGVVSLRIGDRSMNTDCIVGPPQSEPLIGQIVLEELDLLVDCSNQRLIPRPESPDRPLLKMK